MRRILPALVLFSSAIIARADVMCPLESLKERTYADAECQFYLGTTAYRAQIFSVAAAHWMAAADPELTSTQTIPIRTTALSTVSYLRYYGLGIEQDRSRAVADWETAATAGSMEAYSQLGHAFSDREFRHFDPAKSLAWYKAISIRFAGMENLDKTEKEILDAAERSAAELDASLSKKDREKAAELAILFSQLK